MPGDLYATSDSIRLFWMSENDRNVYERLILEVPESRTYTIEKLTDLYWETVLYGGDYSFMIYEDQFGYCGNISLYHPERESPEIGIELFKECRNKGIGPKAVKLLIKEEQKHRKKECYLVRIASNNEHSKHVFEKLGAVLTGTEESIYKYLIIKLEEMLNESEKVNSGIAIKKLQNMIDEYVKVSGKVYEYKLFADCVLENQ